MRGTRALFSLFVLQPAAGGVVNSLPQLEVWMPLAHAGWVAARTAGG